MSEAVTTLQRKRLVRKLRLSQDRRALSLTVTERGRRLAAGFNDWPDRMLDAVSGLPAGDQEGLLRALVHLIYQLQQRGMIPVSRMCITCRYFRPRVHPDPLRPHHCDFVDAPFGDRHLRLDCPEQQPATEKRASRAWKRWRS